MDQMRLVEVVSGFVGIAGLIVLVRGYLMSRKMLREQQNNLMEQQLQQRRYEHQLLVTESILQGHEDERRRIAKDLHDGLGGRLTGIKMSLSNIKKSVLISDENLLVFDRSIDMLNNSIQELRRISHNMMPESLVKFGLSTALRDLCLLIGSMKAIAVNFQIVGEERRIDGSHEVVLYRIVQELVANALKHSDARNILVQVLYEPENLSLTIEDDGTGFDTAILEKTLGSGWPNIRSRVEYLRGMLDVNTSTGEGTSVYINVNI